MEDCALNNFCIFRIEVSIPCHFVSCFVFSVFVHFFLVVVVTLDKVAELNYGLTRSPDFNDSFVMSYHKV